MCQDHQKVGMSEKLSQPEKNLKETKQLNLL
jgi:hypothetical protein